MNSKDKNILAKLVKIANNQQKILEKLAQVTPAANDTSTGMDQFMQHNFTNKIHPSKKNKRHKSW